MFGLQFLLRIKYFIANNERNWNESSIFADYAIETHTIAQIMAIHDKMLRKSKLQNNT